VFVALDQGALTALNDVQSMPMLASDSLVASQWLGTTLEFAEHEIISPHVRRHLALSRFLN
jgi:hypothetical protein